MLADFFELGHRFDEPLAHILGMRGQKAYPSQTIDPVQLRQEVSKCGLFREVVTIRIDILPE